MRLLNLEDISEGQLITGKLVITRELVDGFMLLTGDQALVHVDLLHAQRLGFGDRIAHGFLVGSGYSRLLGMFLPGANTVIQKVHLDMVGPVFIGDTITYEVRVDRIILAVKCVKLILSASNQAAQVINKGIAVCKFLS